MLDLLAGLREAGRPVDQMSERQHAALAPLTEDETAVLVLVQQCLLEAADDAIAHDLKLL